MYIGKKSVSGDVKEILDATANINMSLLDKGMNEFNNSRHALGDILNHDELFDEYPEMSYLPISFQSSDSENVFISGSSSAMLHKIFIDYSAVDAASSEASSFNKRLTATVLHEIQHFIQQVEKTPGGSSPDQWRQAVQKIHNDNPSHLVDYINIGPVFR